MKKLALAVVLSSLLSLSTLAGDGDIHTGGKTCPQNQTCLVSPVNEPSETTETKPVYKEIFEYLKSIFG